MNFKWSPSSTIFQACFMFISFLCFGAIGIVNPISVQAQPTCDLGNWVPVSSSPVGFAEGASLTINNKLYVFSGFINTLEPTARSMVYDPFTDSWTDLTPMPIEVTHTGFAYDPANNEIWIVGGFIGPNGGPATDRVFIYSIDNNSWRDGIPLPAARGSGALVLLGRTLHYFGGYYPDRSTNSENHWALDLDNLAGGWVALANFPQPRGHLAGVVINGLIYAVGGQFFHDGFPPRQASDLLQVYDPTTDTWTQLANLPQTWSHNETSTIVYDGKILVVGGTVNTASVSNRIIEYDPVTDTWRSLPPLPIQLSAMSAGVIDGRLFIANGKIDWVQSQTRAWISSIDNCTTSTLFVPVAAQPVNAEPRIIQFDMTKSGAVQAGGFGAVGDIVDWTVTVTNRGTYPENITITDTLEPSLELISVDFDRSRGDVTIDGRNIRIFVPGVNPNDVISFGVQTRILTRSIDGTIRNTAVLENTGQSVTGIARALPAVTVLPSTGQTPQNRANILMLIGAGIFSSIILLAVSGFFTLKGKNQSQV